MPCASDQGVVGTANFSALQILEAGRRAEADGNRDHAVRFYKHLTVHFAGTFEAADAVTALHRLEDGGPRYAFGAPAHMAVPERTGPPFGVSSAGGPVFATPLLGPPVSPGPITFDGDRRLQSSVAPLRPAQPAARPADETPARSRKRKPKAQDLQDEAVETPRLSRYRVGRFLAGALTLTGGFGAVFGLGALIAGNVLPAARTANTFASAFLASPAIAGGFTLAALAVLLVGQMARAVFALVLHQRHQDAAQAQPGHDDERDDQ